MLNALALTGLTLVAGWSGVARPNETYVVRGAMCTRVVRPQLYIINAEGKTRRLRFRSRAECLTARRRLKPALAQARRQGGAVLVTPIFDDRHRVLDVGLPVVEPAGER